MFLFYSLFISFLNRKGRKVGERQSRIKKGGGKKEKRGEDEDDDDELDNLLGGDEEEGGKWGEEEEEGEEGLAEEMAKSAEKIRFVWCSCWVIFSKIVSHLFSLIIIVIIKIK